MLNATTYKPKKLHWGLKADLAAVQLELDRKRHSNKENSK